MIKPKEFDQITHKVFSVVINTKRSQKLSKSKLFGQKLRRKYDKTTFLRVSGQGDDFEGLTSHLQAKNNPKSSLRSVMPNMKKRSFVLICSKNKKQNDFKVEAFNAGQKHFHFGSKLSQKHGRMNSMELWKKVSLLAFYYENQFI